MLNFRALTMFVTTCLSTEIRYIYLTMALKPLATFSVY
jgi:hypothetical protein